MHMYIYIYVNISYIDVCIMDWAHAWSCSKSNAHFFASCRMYTIARPISIIVLYYMYIHMFACLHIFTCLYIYTCIYSVVQTNALKFVCCFLGCPRMGPNMQNKTTNKHDDTHTQHGPLWATRMKKRLRCSWGFAHP